MGVRDKDGLGLGLRLGSGSVLGLGLGLGLERDYHTLFLLQSRSRAHEEAVRLFWLDVGFELVNAARVVHGIAGFEGCCLFLMATSHGSWSIIYPCCTLIVLMLLL